MSRTPGQRAGLTRERVLAAASEIVAEQGVVGLTMRAVAQRLAVAPNAIYSYVTDKSELVDGVLDGVLAAVDAPADAPPVDALHQLMSSTHAVLLDHRDLVPLYLARQGARGPQARRLGEITLRLLARAGVTGQDAREALRVLIVYTIGFAAFGTPLDDGPVPGEEIGHNFENGLRWLLAGISAR